MNIIITGAGSGIGYHTALTLAADSRNKVYAISRTQQNLTTLVVEHKLQSKLENIVALPFDVSGTDYTLLYDTVLDGVDQVDILINNAGALINKPFADCTDDDLLAMLTGNYITAFKMIKECLPYMNRGAHVVNIGSMGGYQGSDKFTGLSLYSAAKSALHTLTECLAKEYADEGIAFNCLALGSADTDMLRKAFPGYQSPVTAQAMGSYIARFALTGHTVLNGKVLPVAGIAV